MTTEDLKALKGQLIPLTVDLSGLPSRKNQLRALLAMVPDAFWLNPPTIEDCNPTDPVSIFAVVNAIEVTFRVVF